MQNFYRSLLYELMIFISFVIFFHFTDYKMFNKSNALSMMISITSIIVAIIITFIFSKLFSEKTIKVERKREIDELAIKITYLRRIAFHIRGMHKFWIIGKSNAKSVIDSKYKELLYEEYRGYDGYKKYDYNEKQKINEEIHGSIGQSYLALKGLEDGGNRYSFYDEVNPQNYTLDDIQKYNDYVSSFGYFIDSSDSSKVNFNNVSSYEMNFIDELYLKITGKPINKMNYNCEIKELFSSFEAVIFKKHYYLTSLNSDNYPGVFKKSFNNMFVFIILLIISLIVYIIDLDLILSFVFSISLLSIFIANTVDLVFITRQSIKSELTVNEIFKI